MYWFQIDTPPYFLQYFSRQTYKKCHNFNHKSNFNKICIFETCSLRRIKYLMIHYNCNDILNVFITHYSIEVEVSDISKWLDKNGVDICFIFSPGLDLLLNTIFFLNAHIISLNYKGWTWLKVQVHN